MLDAQKLFQGRLKAFKPEESWLDPQTVKVVDGRTMLLIDNSIMALKEASEIHDLLDWKKHRDSYGAPLTKEEIAEVVAENVDLLHFVVNIFLLCGVDSEDVVEQAFFAKNLINHSRQDGGY